MRLNPLWLIWLLFALAITVSPFLTLAEVFRTHSPAPVAAALPVIPFVLAAGAWIFHRFRFAAWEPAVLVAAPVLICLAKAPVATLLAAALFLSAHAIGARALREPPASAILRIALRFGLGLGILILTLFVCGLAGVLYWPLTVLLLLPAVFVWDLLADIRTLRGQWVAMEDLRHPAVSVLVFFGLLFGIVGALWVLTPDIAFDPLKMHLASARWYATTGALTPVPLVPESYYPQGTELIMAMVWLLGGQAAAQLAAPVFFVGTLLVAAGLLRSCGLRPAAVVCGLVAAVSLPFLHWTAFVAKNDFPLAFFLLASLVCLLEKRPLLASFFLAMAFGIKHVALFGAVGLTPLFLREIWLSRRRVRTFFAVAAIFLAFGTVSLIRTWRLTGNPLYPESAARTTDISVVNHPYHSTSERVMRYVGIPWLLHFDGQRAFESSSPNPMGFWLVFFLLGWMAWIVDRSVALRLTLLFCFVYLLYWVSILVTLRYAIAPFLLLTALTAPALFRLPKWLSMAAAFYCLFFSLAVMTLLEVTAPQLLWMAGRLDSDGFLRQALPGYTASQSLRSRVTANDRVLALDGCPNPYMPYPGTVRCYFHYDFADSAPLLLAEIRQGHYRYLILPATPLRDALLQTLPATPVYNDNSFAVYDVEAPGFSR